MADIFISYSSKDRTRIAPLASALGEAGFSLWWDGDIRPGADFAQTIEREIRAAKVVVVAWTPASEQSHWVRDEASFALNQGKLIPLLFGVGEPPLGFRQVQAIDFREWRGDAAAPEFVALVAALRQFQANEGTAPASTQPRGSKARPLAARRIGAAALAGAAMLIAALAIVLVRPSDPPSATRPIAMGRVELRPFAANPDDADRRARAASYVEAVRNRLSEVGILNALAAESQGGPQAELILSGDLAREDGKDFLAVRITDRESGTILWSSRGEPTEGAAREANLAAFALKCALRRRDPERGAAMFSRYLYGCGHFFESDMQAMHAAGKDIYAAAPDDPRAIGFHAVANIALGYAGSESKAEYDRFIGEARTLAAKALKSDPQNADAMFAMGFTVDEFQYAEQERWWRAAIAADDEGWATGRYANFLTTVGRIREAADMERRAFQMRRVHGARAAGIIASLGDLDGARRIYDLTRPVDPGRVARGEAMTTVLYGSVDAAERILAERPDIRDRRCLELALAARRKATFDPAAFAEACGGNGDYSARLYALAGDIDAAFREIDSVLAAGSNQDTHLFWPEMTPFIRDARFWPLARKIGLVDYWLDTDQWPDFCAEPDLPFECRAKAKEARAAAP